MKIFKLLNGFNVLASRDYVRGCLIVEPASSIATHSNRTKFTLLKLQSDGAVRIVMTSSRGGYGRFIFRAQALEQSRDGKVSKTYQLAVSTAPSLRDSPLGFPIATSLRASESSETTLLHVPSMGSEGFTVQRESPQRPCWGQQRKR